MTWPAISLDLNPSGNFKKIVYKKVPSTKEDLLTAIWENLFGFFAWWYNNLYGLFNAKAILVEEQ